MPATRYPPAEYAAPARGGADRPPETRRGANRGRATGGRRGDPLWAQLLVMFGALLMMTSGAVVVGEKVLFRQVDSGLTKISVLPTKRVSIKGAVNILLVGIDQRPDESARSDSIIILHIPASHDRAYLVSIPRDSRVPIPPFPATGYAGGTDKINAAFSIGSTGKNGGLANGVNLLSTTISRFTGIQFHALAIVNFDGFRSLVSALGGVDMCVDQKVTSIHIGTDRSGHFATPFTQDANGNLHPVPGVKPVVYLPRCPQHLAPWQALDYVRQRDLLENPDGSPTNADYDRQRHQQQFVKAVFKQALSTGLTNPTKIKSIISAAGQAVTVDLGGVDVETWVTSMVNVRDMTMIKSNGGKFNPVTGANGVKYEMLSQDTLNLLRAVANDDIDTFTAQHPDWISTG